MANAPIDALTRAVALAGHTRRDAVQMLAVAGIGAAGMAATDAEAKKKRRKKKKKRKCKTPSVDATIVACPGPRENGLTGTRRVAQTFTAPETGAVTAATVELAGGPAGADFIIDIRTVDGDGVPTNTVLASETINDVPATPPGQPRTLAVLFDSPAAVQQGEQFAIALTDTPVSIGYTVSTRNGDDCEGQCFVDTQADGMFSPVAGFDLIFSISIAFVS